MPHPSKAWYQKQNKFDSQFEENLNRTILKKWTSHSERIPYLEPSKERKYSPDFTRVIDGKKIHIEAKGRFRELKEAQKYVWIRDSLGEDEELVFILYRRNTTMPNAKERLDGTKRTHEEFLEDNGFRYFYIDNFPVSWTD